MSRREELDAAAQASIDTRQRAASAELQALMDAERPALIAALASLAGRSTVSRVHRLGDAQQAALDAFDAACKGNP